MSTASSRLYKTIEFHITQKESMMHHVYTLFSIFYIEMLKRVHFVYQYFSFDAFIYVIGLHNKHFHFTQKNIFHEIKQGFFCRPQQSPNVTIAYFIAFVEICDDIAYTRPLKKVSSKNEVSFKKLVSLS